MGVAFHVCYDHYEHTMDLHIFAGVHQTLDSEMKILVSLSLPLPPAGVHKAIYGVDNNRLNQSLLLVNKTVCGHEMNVF